jgi:hypothetical protein
MLIGIHEISTIYYSHPKVRKLTVAFVSYCEVKKFKVLIRSKLVKSHPICDEMIGMGVMQYEVFGIYESEDSSPKYLR